MQEIRMKLEKPEVLFSQPEGYTKIKPEENIGVEDARSLWDNLFNDMLKDSNNTIEKSHMVSGYMNIKPEMAGQEISYNNKKNPLNINSLEKVFKSDSLSGKDIQNKEGLTKEEKEIIKEESGWSDEIVDAIKSMEEYEIYKNAGLHEGEINGRKCLLKDIDLDYVDKRTGMTNRELMEKGLSPIDSKTGERIELHHLGQEFDSPFVELCADSEHGDGNHKILHTKTSDSWRNNPSLKRQYQIEKRNHWKTRIQ